MSESVVQRPPERGTFLSRVIDRTTLCREHFEIGLRVRDFPPAEPGQFVQIMCRPVGETGISSVAPPGSRPGLQVPCAVLRRPFSIAGLTRQGGDARIEIVGRVVGPGTAWLDALDLGDRVDLLGPLGRPFSLPNKGVIAILIAGGVGVPPIRWLAEKLCKQGLKCESIVGARSRELLPVRLLDEPRGDGHPTLCVQEFARHGAPTSVTTDDGTCGLFGDVTRVFEQRLAAHRAPDSLRVFACGPEAMLRAVGAICMEGGVRCEVAMERVMGCGMGTCQSCVVPVREETSQLGWRYALCCTEGPVFDARALIGLRVGMGESG